MNRIVHIGLGNFHRAHQAWYTQNAGGWQITGVSLRSPGMRDLLRPQGYDYSLVIRDADSTVIQKITVLDDILVAPEDPEAVVALIGDPDTRIVTLTVTEKGYCLAPGTADLNLSHPDIRHDLDNPGAPRSTIGLLACGLARRGDTGAGPITVISCDNQTDNGATLGRAVIAFADAAALTIARNRVTFPGTMVDRITPAPPPDLADKIADQIDWPDRAPVETEAFSEWVIEDDFAGPRPDWDNAGAQIVSDVRPFENRKLRMLNGAHTMLAYRGTLAGHTYVHEAIADPLLHAETLALMDGAAETLDGADPADLATYRDSLIARFQNPTLAHRLRQIAMDGSQKMPLRILDPMADRLAAGLPITAHAWAVAGWIAFLRKEQADGATPDDPQADALADILGTPLSASDTVRAVLALIDGRTWSDDAVAAIAAPLDRGGWPG